MFSCSPGRVFRRSYSCKRSQWWWGKLEAEMCLDGPAAVRALVRGDLCYPGAVAARLFQRLAAVGARDGFASTDLLTPREKEVVQHVSLELSNKEIATRLCVF